MIFTAILLILFLAVSSVNADYTTCKKYAENTGYCNVYTDKGEYIKNRHSACRKVRPFPPKQLARSQKPYLTIEEQASACNVDGNGCWLNAQKIDGIWYSNCS